MKLIDRVHTTLERFSMIRPGERVLVGVSGGPDSVALAHVLAELEPRVGFSVALAHLHHGLRAEADDDERFCRDLATALGREYVAARVDVAARARESGRSIEHAGRDARYRFFETESERLGCQRIAVGHTADDQAETLLLRLFRGSGPRGLAAVHPVVEGRRVRPLLECRRADVEAYLRERRIPFRSDATNRDPRFSRNRLRHETLPHLRRAFNPRLTDSLATTAAIFRDEEAWMEAEIDALYETMARAAGPDVVLDVPSLLAAHPAVRRRVLRRGLAAIRGHLMDLGHVHVEDALALLGPGKSGREVHLPGARVLRSFDSLTLRPEPGRSRRGRDESGYNTYEYRLSFPASVRISERGGTLTVGIWRPGLGAETPPASGDSVVVGIGRARERPEILTVRSPRPGDRFQPLGAPGSKSLARYLMERRVARDDRRLVPLVCAAPGSAPAGEILWVVGHGVSESARLSPDRGSLALSWVAG